MYVYHFDSFFKRFSVTVASFLDSWATEGLFGIYDIIKAECGEEFVCLFFFNKGTNPSVECWYIVLFDARLVMYFRPVYHTTDLKSLFSYLAP
jgi:hypothetical protein